MLERRIIPNINKLMCYRNAFLLVLSALTASNLLAGEQPLSAAQLSEKGKYYELARGVKLDYKEAFRLYCLALNKGDVLANYRLGMNPQP